MTYKTKRVPNSQMTNIGYALSLLYFILCMIRVFKARSAVFLVDLGGLLSFTCYFSEIVISFTVSLVFYLFFSFWLENSFSLKCLLSGFLWSSVLNKRRQYDRLGRRTKRTFAFFLHEVLLLIILSINNNSPLSEEGFVHPQAPNRMFRE